MESKDEKNLKLPVAQKDIKMLKKAKQIDGLKRFGKAVAGIGGGIILYVGGIGVATLTGPAIGAISIGVGIAAGVLTTSRGLVNALYQVEPNLLFAGKNDKNGVKIKQDNKVSVTSQMKGYSKDEKIGMMQLQTLVGLSKYKDNLVGTQYTEKADGTRVYDKNFSTVTHSINAITFKAMENLGLIEIVGTDKKIGKTLAGKPKEKKSFLLMERIGFGNKEDLAEMVAAIKARDFEKLKSKRKTMEKWTFRLTDKPIDFEELYSKYQQLESCDAKEKTGLRVFRNVFSPEIGILSQRNIDIGKDRYGRDVMRYGVKENFAQRIKKEIEEKKDNISTRITLETQEYEGLNTQKHEKNKTNEWEESLREGVDQEAINEVVRENAEKPQDVNENRNSQKAEKPNKETSEECL